ncbi:MAG: hypothetical protein JWN99_1357 [Ilumatobacteraceae bacterium]|nr:hypothetical protein [Ilumatobacteraceae bacterium]
MLSNDADLAPAVTETLASLSRTTPWQLVDELPLRFDAHHPQGMVRIGQTWWISTVDVDARQGWVLAVDDRGDLVQRVAVGAGPHYHPGGMDFDGTALWLACAEYRPDSTTVIQRLQPGGVPDHVFQVDDHIGAIARCGPHGDLVGWSWGSRRFYRWSVDGRLLAARVNPTFFVDHQDCQWMASGHLLCAGVAEVGLASGPGWLGGLGLLGVDDLVMQREVPFAFYSSATGRVATHNPVWSEVRGNRLIVHLLPDDGRGAIVSYATPLIERSG